MKRAALLITGALVLSMWTGCGNPDSAETPATESRDKFAPIQEIKYENVSAGSADYVTIKPRKIYLMDDNTTKSVCVDFEVENITSDDHLVWFGNFIFDGFEVECNWARHYHIEDVVASNTKAIFTFSTIEDDFKEAGLKLEDVKTIRVIVGVYEGDTIHDSWQDFDLTFNVD